MAEKVGLGLLLTGLIGALFILGAAANEIVRWQRALFKAYRLIAREQRWLMSQIEDLQAAVVAVSDGVAGFDSKLDEVLTSVQAVIALLQAQGGDSPVVAQAIVDLQAAAARMGSVQAEAQAIKDAADAAAGA